MLAVRALLRGLLLPGSALLERLLAAGALLRALLPARALLLRLLLAGGAPLGAAVLGLLRLLAALAALLALGLRRGGHGHRRDRGDQKKLLHGSHPVDGANSAITHFGDNGMITT